MTGKLVRMEVNAGFLEQASPTLMRGNFQPLVDGMLRSDDINRPLEIDIVAWWEDYQPGEQYEHVIVLPDGTESRRSNEMGPSSYSGAVFAPMGEVSLTVRLVAGGEDVGERTITIQQIER